MNEPEETFEEIWVEVSNIAFYTGAGGHIGVQLKNDLDTERSFKFNADSIETLTDAMKEKRPIHAKLAIKNGEIGVTDLRVAFSASRAP